MAERIDIIQCKEMCRFSLIDAYLIKQIAWKQMKDCKCTMNPFPILKYLKVFKGCGKMKLLGNDHAALGAMHVVSAIWY